MENNSEHMNKGAVKELIQGQRRPGQEASQNKNILLMMKGMQMSKGAAQESTFSNILPRLEVPYIGTKSKNPAIQNFNLLNREGVNSVQELFAVEDFIISLTTTGICTSYNKFTGDQKILNTNPSEKIRSIFHNQLNDAIFIVSVKERQDSSKMKCRSLPIRALKQGEIKGQKLFKEFVLKWPDFIEFDELNGKIVTKHTEQNAYRVWSLESYSLLFVLTHEFLAEFKICNGIMLLLFNPVNNSIPMTIINVHTGEPLMNIAYQGHLKDIEFVEQFNENILIKQKDKPLKIHDILTNQSQHIINFESPDAFIFIYEKECFISLQGGRITMWSTEGNMISNFNKQILYSQCKDKKENDRNYVISLSSSRKYLFTLIKENQLEPQELLQIYPNPQPQDLNACQENPELANPVLSPPIQQSAAQLSQHLNRITSPIQGQQRLPNIGSSPQRMNNVTLNVIDIQKGQIISSINPMSMMNGNCSKDQKLPLKTTAKKYEKLMNSITYVYYDETRHEIVTGHENGNIVIWQ